MEGWLKEQPTDRRFRTWSTPWAENVNCESMGDLDVLDVGKQNVAWYLPADDSLMAGPEAQEMLSVSKARALRVLDRPRCRPDF